MPSPRTLSILPLALVALAAAADAQRDLPRWCARGVDAATLAQKLATGDPATVAWAAWAVRRDRARDMVPAVRRALAAPQLAADDDVAVAARLLLLDALLTFEVRLPAEELLVHDRDPLRVPVLLLATLEPRTNLEFIGRRYATAAPGELAWHACGNLLAHDLAPGFAAACLQQCELRLRFTVHDDGATGTDFT